MQYKSPSKSNFKEIQIEQREFLINQLKDENFCLKQRERDFAKYSETLLVLQKNLDELKVYEEGIYINKSLKENLQIKNVLNLKEEIIKLKKELEPKTGLNKKLTNELDELKTIIMNVQEDLKSKYEFNEFQEKLISDLSIQLKHEESRLNFLTLDSKTTTEELGKTKILKDRILATAYKKEEIIKSNLMKSQYLEKEYLENSQVINLLKNEKSQLHSQLLKKFDEKQTHEKEGNIFQKFNLDLVREDKKLEQRSILISSHIKRLESKLQEIDTLIKEKENEILNTNLGLKYNVSKEKDSLKILKDLKEEREHLILQIGNYKQEGETSKILQEDYLRKLNLIDHQKKLVEKELIEKDKLASSAKKTITLEAEFKKKLEEDQYYLDQELNSLKDHTFLLENQNLKLYNEIDLISNGDEKLMSELDRKSRLDLLKKSNLNELQRSAEKVRLSQSPKKISTY